MRSVQKIRAQLDAKEYVPTGPHTEALWQAIFESMQALEALPGEGMAQTWAAMKTSDMPRVLFDTLALSVGHDPQVGRPSTPLTELAKIHSSTRGKASQTSVLVSYVHGL